MSIVCRGKLFWTFFFASKEPNVLGNVDLEKSRLMKNVRRNLLPFSYEENNVEEKLCRGK